MRVASAAFPDMLVNQLGTLALRQNQLQNQAATGQRVQYPEDDPAAMREAMAGQAEAGAVAQYQNNIGTLQGVSQATYSAMKSVQTITDRVNQIATQADGTKSPADLQNYATEVGQLLQEAVQLANTQYQGNYLFGGTKSDQPPFVATTNSGGLVTGVSFQGNQSLPQSEIAQGVTLSAQVVGANSTGSGPPGLFSDSRSGADLFNHLISLQNHLLSGNITAIKSTDAPQLASDESNLINQMSSVGAVQSRLDTDSTLAQDQTTALTKQVSNLANADLAQTLVQLSQAQNAYRAALQSGALIMNNSLLDYLK